MIDLNDEYYVLEPDNNNNYPMIGASLRPRSLDQIFTNDYTLNIYLDPPIPKKPEYVDFHTSGSTPVVSKAMKDLLEPLEINGIQFLKGTKGDVIDELKLDYYLLHIYSRVICIDKDKSDVKLDDEDDEVDNVLDVKTLVIDSDLLLKTPEENRLIFKVREYGVIQLFHKSIVDVIESAGLKGLRFIPVKKWNDNAAFH
jgi:hypothetical protein